MSADALSDTPAQPSKRRYLGVVAAIYLVHLLLSLHAVPPSAVFGDRPFGNPDYQTHFGQTQTLTKALDRFGKLWVYDPNVLAGAPVGLIFDVDNKSHFLFTYALHRLGVPLPIGFNLFGWLTFLLAPLALLLAAQIIRVSPRAQLWAMGLGTLLWNFDSSARLAWSGGMISYAMVAYLTLVVWALFYRLLDGGGWRQLVPLAILLPLCLHTHVWAFGILVVPMIGLFIHRRRSLSRREHLRVWGLALFALAANLHWLVPALRHFYLVAPSGVIGQTNPGHIFSEFFEIIVDPLKTGFVMPHTLYRVIAAAGAVLALRDLRKAGDARFFYAALSLGWLFFMAYFAALIPGLRETEPYRFVMSFEFLAAILASIWLAKTLRWSWLRALPAGTKALVVVLSLLVLPRFVAPVLYFIPELRPDARFPPFIIDPRRKDNRGPLFTLGRPNLPLPSIWRLTPTGDTLMALSAYVKEACTEPGRILVQHWVIGEHLYWATGKPVIGGFPDRRLIHEAANLFHRPADPRYWDSEFADYLVRYNIRYVVMTNSVPPVERRTELLEPKKMIGAHRVYRVRHRGGWFIHGRGKLTADLNRIEVTDAEAAEGTQAVALRFHHMKSLRCRPVDAPAGTTCRVVKFPLPYDPVGFFTVIGTPALPRHFVVEQQY